LCIISYIFTGGTIVDRNVEIYAGSEWFMLLKRMVLKVVQPIKQMRCLFIAGSVFTCNNYAVNAIFLSGR